MDRYEFIIAMTSIVLGTGTMVVLFHSIATVLSRRKDAAMGDGAVARLDDRLSRMEQAIDTMAVEMERISEGQRFTTKLLSERAPVADAGREPARDRLKA